MVNLKNDWPWIWGIIVSILVILGGGLFFIGSIVELPGLEIMGEETYDPIVGSGTFEDMSNDQRQHHDWIVGVLGTTMIGWGLLSVFVIWHGLRPWIQEEYPDDRQWAWQALVVSYLFWFVTDTGISALNEVWFNVVFNIIIFVLLIIPLTALSTKYLK